MYFFHIYLSLPKLETGASYTFCLASLLSCISSGYYVCVRVLISLQQHIMTDNDLQLLDNSMQSTTKFFVCTVVRRKPYQVE